MECSLTCRSSEHGIGLEALDRALDVRVTQSDF